MFDVKLTDGRYFKNIDFVDNDFGEVINISSILDWGYKMQIYHENDFEGEDLLAEIKSDDIEYVCKAYKYREAK